MYAADAIMIRIIETMKTAAGATPVRVHPFVIAFLIAGGSYLILCCVKLVLLGRTRGRDEMPVVRSPSTEVVQAVETLRV